MKRAATSRVARNVGNLPILECDPVLTKQVFQILLASAFKFRRKRAPAIIEIGSTADQENKRRRQGRSLRNDGS